MFNALGVGLSFVLGTYLVDECTAPDCVARARQAMKTLLWFHAGAALLITVLFILYFPSSPPSPPSRSAVQTRTLFLKGFGSLVKSRNAWFTMITYALSQGVTQMWLSVLVISLPALNVPGLD